MALTLYYHPLASFCWKPLIALYENEIPFTPHIVDLGDAKAREDFCKLWPLGQFPVLQEESRQQLIPQSTFIIEYLELFHPGKIRLIPEEAEAALEARRWNEFYDTYVHVQMQKIVTDFLRPAGQNDSYGVTEARRTLKSAYGILEARMGGKTWSVGANFTLADCSAAPALYYGDKVSPLSPEYPRLSAYLERLKARPSFARVLKEAEPYFHMFPYKG